MKKIFSIVLLLAVLSASHAQRYDVFRLSVGLNGGLSAFTVSDKNLEGSLKMGTEYGAELGFSVFFSQHFGIRTGLGFSVLNGEYDFENITKTSTLRSLQTINYTTVMQDPKYVFRSSYAMVPIQLAFRSQHWYADLGVKVAIPLKSQQDFSVAGTETNAEVAGLGTITPDSPIASTMGCTRTPAQTFSNKDKSSQFLALLTLDGGYTIVKAPDFSWTIGLYGEYAINSTAIKGDGTVMVPNADGTVSKELNPVSVAKLGYFGFGIKLQCDFGIKAK